jgi:undecaprenyl-diphosphatase
MHDCGLALLLGLVEGLTEFLPVSSTAHLRMAEALLGLDLSDPYWKMFSIVIQSGAILCLPIYFRRRLTELVATFPRGIRGDRSWLTHPLTLTLVAFICTAAPAFLMTRIIGAHLESLPLMACALIAGGAVMWTVDATFGRRQTSGDVEDIRPRHAVWIGLCQTLSAVFPGTSRSMSTITAGELMGLSRSTALEFSFLLSIPTMVAATGYDLVRFVRQSGVNAPAESSDTHGIVVLLIGFVMSFVVAWGVVAWLMRWVRRRGFVPFAIYRIIVGGAVLGWLWR